MELLYVWIEKYKNIEKQGFNFSPKYHVHYDNATCTLSIEDIDCKQPKRFFAEEILNITAIIGKNGSGKNTLLRFLVSDYNINKNKNYNV